MRTLLSAGLTGVLLLASSHAENLLENGSFELPKIAGRIPAEKGGNPSLPEEKTLWTSLISAPGEEGGTLRVGLTDEIAHEGKQSLFVDFAKLTAPRKRAMLVSELLPIQPNEKYRISIWGRLNRERPLAMDERRPYLLLEVQYLAADQERQIGNTDYRVQMIPGNIVPGLGTRILFVSGKWNEYFTEVKSPTESAFMKVTFNFQAAKDQGETDGVLYLDNAAVDGVRGTTPLTLPEAETEEEAGDANPAPAAPTEPSSAQPRK